MRILAALLCSLVLAHPAGAAPRWVRANFHAHSGNDRLRDDGVEPVAALHRAVRGRGLDFSVHSPHSTLNTGGSAPAAFRAQRAAEARLRTDGLVAALGEELTVANGPRYQARIRVLGQEAPGNLNHLTVLGMNELVPSGLPLAAACARVHHSGGVCIVNHPGPGPMMWEEGLWEAPGNRGQIDALEVYNGQALAVVGLDFEARYLAATAAELGLHIAAVSGADTHGPDAVEHGRSRLAQIPGGEVLRSLFAAPPAGARPELEAVTLVRADSAAEADVLRALRERRTVATYGLPGLTLELPGLGEVQRSARREMPVQLRLRLSRKMAEVTLYREGRALATFRDTAQVSWDGTVTQPTAFVFGGREGSGRFLTSALWFEPAVEAP